MSQPPLEKDQLLPAFRLPAADGMPYSLWDYKQRENLVLLFVQSATASTALLRTFAEHFQDFREENCAILVITANTVVGNLEAQATLKLPFPLLADPTGGVISYYTQWNAVQKTLSPSILLANRYNALYEQCITERESDFPAIAQVLASLRYLNSICTP